mgnify:CR=1 FL=1
MADKIVTDFLKNIKAKSGEAIKWFKSIVKQTQRAAFPAATGRKEDWYEKAFLANPKAIWTFGIDGPPHLSHWYRKNQKGEFLFKMMLMARLMGIKTHWQYIIFSWNKKYMDECKALAERYGIEMVFIKSRRGMQSLNE